MQPSRTESCDMVPYVFADVRFNSGRGALLCNRCNVILKEGFEHTDISHFCDECFPNKDEWILQEYMRVKRDVARRESHKE